MMEELSGFMDEHGFKSINEVLGHRTVVAAMQGYGDVSAVQETTL